MMDDKQRESDLARAHQLRDEVMQGLHAGEPAERLLLKAIESMALTENDTVSFAEAKQTMIAVYGDALAQKVPLQIELEEFQKRRERIKESYERFQNTEEPDTLERMLNAIRTHDHRIEYLKARLADHSQTQEE